MTDTQQRRGALVRTAEGILATARSQGRSLNDAERQDYDKILAKIDRLETGTARRTGDDTFDLELRENGRAAVGRYELQQMRGAPQGGVDVRDGSQWKSLGEFLQGVISAGTRGGAQDPRLQTRALGMSEAGTAGFAVDEDFSTELLSGVMAESTLAKRCKQIPISSGSNSVKLPAPKVTNQTQGNRWCGISLAWADEGGTLSVSKPELRMLQLSLKKLGGVSYLTSELLEDSAALEAFVRAAFGAEFAWELDSAIMRGPGAGTPLGFLNSAALVTVAKETSQIADTIVSENVIKMFSRMTETSLKDAVWLVSQSCWPQIFQFKQVVRNAANTENVGGAPLFMTGNGGIADAPFGTILGRPVLPVPQASAVGDVGDISFVNLSKYLLAQKGGVRTASSIHVAFLTDEVALRWVLRVDGQPYLDAPITPAYGSDTQSDFVTLAARA